MAAVALQGAAVAADGLVDRVAELLAFRFVEEFVHRHQQRRIRPEAQLVVDGRGQLVAGLDLVFRLGFGDISPHLFDDLLAHGAAPPLDGLGYVQAAVPHGQIRHDSKLPDGLLVGPHPGRDHGPDGLAVEAAGPGGDLQAGRQPLEIPFERARRGLIEVVDIEEHLPLG